MGRRGRSRGGRSSRGRSSRGRSSSKSRGRSSSRKSSSRKSSTSSRRSTSRGRTSSKGRATKRTTRTKTTRSAPARRAATRTSRATPRRVRRTVVKRVRTVSPPRPRLTGGRIAQKPQTVRNTLTTPNRMVSSVFGKRTQDRLAQSRFGIFAQQKASNIAGAPVTVTFPSGRKQTMRLSTAAIKHYQNQGLRVSPVTFTQSGFNPMATISNWFQPTQTAHASPQIPRIQNQTPAWSSNPPPQLHVSTPMHVKPNTRTNSNFGGLGANPWDPAQSLAGLFGMSPQEKPATQFMPQQQNTQSTGYPTYTAMAQGQYQEQAFDQSRQGFANTMSGDSSFNAGDTIKGVLQNQYVIYAGLAVGALVILKMVMGGRGQQVVYR